MSKLSYILDNIRNDWSQLRHEWQSCSTEWNDGVARTFEREHWQEYERVLPFAIDKLEELDNLIQTALEEIE